MRFKGSLSDNPIHRSPRWRGFQPLFFKSARFRLVLAALAVAVTSLTCSLGGGASSSPPFIAPGGAVIPAVTPTTPQIISISFSPTPAPATAGPSPEAPSATPGPTATFLPPLMYNAQAGDILTVVSIRFGVTPDEIRALSPGPLPEDTALLPPGQLLIIPAQLANTTSSQKLIPDSEVVNSPSSANFDVAAYVEAAGGYLSTYQEYLYSTGNTSGARVVARVAEENSISPRLLLALLEYQSGWVYGSPGNLAQQDYPLGHIDLNRRGLYKQLVWAVRHLSVGYYGWRQGLVTEVSFSDGISARLAPDLNAGTVALQYFFAQLYTTEGWVQALDSQAGFPVLYEQMFGSSWERAVLVEPLYPTELTQPPLILPFLIEQLWSYTGGPHGAWEHEGARAALDFAPASAESGCVWSDAWVVSSAAGLVVRSGNGIVIIDLDGDGYEQTGWVLLYLHIATNGRIPQGRWVETADRIGHPSCEGGASTGTHVHIARKYNGEWIPADGPVPFNLSGWVAQAGADEYLGTLTRDGITIPSSIYGSFESRIRRYADNP